MTLTTPGLHHVTAITADAQQNLNFYCGVLGLRLVKLTVNFDDPNSYHLYYGDELGSPGTILTFFAWAGAYPGRVGPPQVTVISFAAPAGGMDFWEARLREHHAQPSQMADRFGEPVLSFADPDGIRLEIVGTRQPASLAANSDVPSEHALRGLHSVTIAEEGHENAARLLTDTMGFRQQASQANRFRFQAGDATAGSLVDLLCLPDAPHGTTGAGVVHHVAFRTPSDAQQVAWRRELVLCGFNVSPVMDRSYFHSIYFREPGGVLFEIATDGPGFAIDERPYELGSHLKLPPQYEPYRAQLDDILPPLRLPHLAASHLA